jgi:hypothetical protein
MMLCLSFSASNTKVLHSQYMWIEWDWVGLNPK